jgi:hypothetical protein
MASRNTVCPKSSADRQTDPTTTSAKLEVRVIAKRDSARVKYLPLDFACFAFRLFS